MAACYYGWWVVVGCVLVRLATAPGHSFGISALVEHLIDDGLVARTQLSFLWMLASCTSAILTPCAGSTIDSLGARRCALLLVPVLPLTVLALSFARNGMSIGLSFFAIRFVGPECLTLIATTTYQRWFVRRRGVASALFGLNGVILMAMPSLLTPVIEVIGWRDACRALALLLPMLLLLGGVLIYDSPTDVGLQSDGDTASVLRGASLPPATESWYSDDCYCLADTKVMAVNVKEVTDDEEVPDEELPACISAPSEHAVDGSRTRAGSADATPLASAPLAAMSLKEASAHPLFLCLCSMEIMWGIFNGGFNISFVSVIGSLGGDLSGLSASQTSRDTFLIIALTQNAAKVLTGEPQRASSSLRSSR